MRLADQNAAEIPQLFDDRRVEPADSALVDRRSVFGGEAAGFDDVLRAKRNVRQRAGAGRHLRCHLDPRLD